MSTDPTTPEFPVPKLPNDAVAVTLENLANAEKLERFHLGCTA
jgi:hypothetical protein